MYLGPMIGRPGDSVKAPCDAMSDAVTNNLLKESNVKPAWIEAAAQID